MAELTYSHDGTVPLGDSARVPPQEIRVGQYVHRARPDGSNAGWYRVLDVVWQPDNQRYQIRIARPDALRNLMPDHYHQTYASREAVRSPLTDKEPTR